MKSNYLNININSLIYLLLVCMFGLIVFFTNKNEIQGAVVKIYDGDTITIQNNDKIEKIRLYGIDAPELKQEFGIESRNYLLSLCPLNSIANIKIQDTDRYKRKIGIVSCQGIKDVNRELVKNGYAWAYNKYSKAYIRSQIKAQANKRGLWRANNPINPEEYRKK